MNIQSVTDVIRKNLKYFGLRCTAYDLGIRLVNRIAFFRTLRVVCLSELEFHEPLVSRFHFKRIPAAELARLALIPEYGINPALLEKIGRSQNSCFGIYEGNRLAQYLFFFTEPTLMSDDLLVTFGAEYAYLCATFTHPDYRGLHLNSIGVGLAAKEYRRLGFPVLLAYVESNNFSSLKSLQRIGWRDVGSIDILRLFGRYFIRTGKGCDAFGFRVISTPAVPERPAHLTNRSAS